MRISKAPLTRALLAAWAGLATPFAAAAQPQPTEPTCRPALRLAEQALERDEWGQLALASRYLLDEALLERSGQLSAALRTRLDLGSARMLRGVAPATFCISVLADDDGELNPVFQRAVEVETLAGADTWSFHVQLALPEATAQILVVIEETGTGAWGAAVAEDAEVALRSPGLGVVRLEGEPAAWYELSGSGTANANVGGSVPGGLGPAALRRTMLRIIPPQDQPVAGSTLIETLVTSDEVDRVVFFLDGVQVAERKRRPFLSRIELAKPPKVQELRAVAYDEKDFELGQDTVRINEVDAPFRVSIAKLEGDPASGAVDVEAKVSIPLGARLEKVELYRNADLVATWNGPPYRARVAISDPQYGDFVRVAAYLADGTSIDNVRLLSAQGEEVEVNLVEVFAVVTDSDGQPVKDLEATDFTIVHRGQPKAVERFAYADDVPLLLGLVIDTSGSMRLLMDATKRAAARFLGDTVLPTDRGFVVDFDQRPRLLQETTGELTDLLLSLGHLEPEGKTAIYDAVIFSMLQFESQPGRKALVVLSDGDDRDSRFGPKDCVEYGRKLGVPIYVIGLGALDGQARSLPKGELRKITSETGGELHMVESFDELGAAYARINGELRNQYSLGFYTDTDLSQEERRELEVRVSREGLEVRVVVGAKSP